MVNQTLNAIQTLLRKNAAVSLLGNGTAAVISLSTTGLLARWMPREAFGNWVLFLVTYTLFDTLRSGLLLNGMIQYTADLRVESRTYASSLKRWEGAVWQLGLLITMVVGPLLIGLTYCFPTLSDWVGNSETAVWFWIISLVSLPANIATWFLHARSQFRPLQWIRVLTQLVFLLLIVGCYQFHLFPAKGLYGLFAIANGAISVWALFIGWSQWRSIPAGRSAQRNALFHFGKYTIGTLVGSNLQRSADTLLLGALLGPEAVALYAIPQRLTQLLDMPIRSVVVTAMPRLVKLQQQGKASELAAYFQQSAGLLWLVMLPLSIAGFVLAEPLVTLLGGGHYRDGATLMRCFMLYGALLPLDRYSGVGLDAIGKPQFNLIKVLFMLCIQIGGALVALLVFKSTTALAGVSIFTFALGMMLGFRLLKRHVPITLTGCIQTGWTELVSLITRFRHEWIRSTVKNFR
ncbi:lipopolysaccharide biosynthesis protein [Spirosoma fluviale]|uniref:Membrane protein involved in the export of O-antigen and teichoic acid n=1 Tax=Spirosoma fluviale TaxID=1597977 RepID=A0A286GC90_9BACT|nr:lipopolysaccharide biosynthesis protein [Spirosoma fluviale]SOD93137.1 Membrane protein involved in the export of O-antigen and teichoic acid [Spirosoma fluviale]